jgi:branched-chain amino acid transport system permease protein
MLTSLHRAPLRTALIWGVYPVVATLATLLLARFEQPAISIVLALAIVTPMGPLIWRFAFRPVADASVLALLIIAMALHFVLPAPDWCSSVPRKPGLQRSPNQVSTLGN